MPVPARSQRIRRSSARMLVFDQVREWIEEGVLAPGEVIKDVEIAERLGVSRTPVREALQSLEQVGAVEMFPNHQTRVSGLNPTDVRLVYPPLACLIQLAARTAAPSVTDDHIAVMADFNERMLAAAKAGDDSAARAADERFHAVLVEATENPYLTNALQTLRIHLRRLGALYFRDVPPGRRSYEEHLAIIGALMERDPEGTDNAVKNHYDRAVADLVAYAEKAD